MFSGQTLISRDYIKLSLTTINVTVASVVSRKDPLMQERLIGGGVAAAIFLPLLFIGGLPFQLLVGAMAMIAVS